MQKSVKSIMVKAIKRCPFNSLRILLYRKLLGYSIGKNVKIGRSSINCRTVTIGDNVVIRNNNILSCNELVIGSGTRILSGNTISGSSDFSIGKDSRIINYHFIDVSKNVTIGNNTWIAGRGSQFWTHGSLHTKTGKKDLGITIKNNCYIGSNCSFGPGVTVENDNLIALGSVVLNSVRTSKNLILGNPAKVVKEEIDWRKNW